MEQAGHPHGQQGHQNDLSQDGVGGVVLVRQGGEMSVAIGSSCLFGFPGTVIISNEVSESTGTTAEEKATINAQIMPKMLVAGMVTVSITSVLVAGVMSAWL